MVTMAVRGPVPHQDTPLTRPRSTGAGGGRGREGGVGKPTRRRQGNIDGVIPWAVGRASNAGLAWE